MCTKCVYFSVYENLVREAEICTMHSTYNIKFVNAQEGTSLYNFKDILINPTQPNPSV